MKHVRVDNIFSGDGYGIFGDEMNNPAASQGMVKILSVISSTRSLLLCW